MGQGLNLEGGPLQIFLSTFSIAATMATPRKSIWDRDLDDPSRFQVDISTSASTRGPSSSSQPKKPKTAHDKDPTYPPPCYSNFAYQVCLEWYEGQSVQMLETKYLRYKGPGIDALRRDFESLITKKCRDSTDYGDVDETYFGQFQKWMDNSIQTCIFNTKKLMGELRPVVPGYVESDKSKEFRSMMEWWQTAAKRLSKAESRGYGWQTDALRAALSQDGGSCILWIYSTVKVVPLTGYDSEGGYGKVRKVRFEGMNTIPTNVLFAAKVSKAKSLSEARVQRSTEALVCSLNHPAIIKFLAIHADTMEAYTLWWNGGNLRQLIGLNDKVVPHAEWHQIKLVKELLDDQVKQITLYRKHRAKLAWALIYVMSLVHSSGVLHNDLSPMNILLHYPGFSDEVINIGICDWGISSRIPEGALSHYGYQTEAERQKVMSSKWWVAPELFYQYGPQNSATSLEKVRPQHKYSVKSDSFSIGKLCQAMKIQDIVQVDKDLFPHEDGLRYFALKVRELYKPEVDKRATCAQVVDLLMGKPWSMKPPEFVFRDSVL